jgi:biotin transport system substrate-specific component
MSAMHRNTDVKAVSVFTRAKLFKELLLPLAISLLIFGSGLIRIPFYPVPFTLQTLAIPMLCLLSSRKHMVGGLLLFVAYRIFQSGTGVLLTSGYIAGFFAMPYILAPAVRKGNALKLAIKISVSELIILFSGAIVLAAFVGLNRAFRSGFLFFIPAEILKITIVVGICKLLDLSKNGKHSKER